MRLYKPYACCTTRSSSTVSCDTVVECVSTQLTRIANGQSTTLVNFCTAVSACVNAQLLAISLNESTFLTNYGPALETYLKTFPGYTATGDIFLSLNDDVYEWQTVSGGGGTDQKQPKTYIVGTTSGAPTNGSSTWDNPAFANSWVVLFLGSIPVPTENPGDGSIYASKTLASSILTLTNGTFSTGDVLIYILITPTP